jgi:lipopolysaccharide export system protein LptA
MKHLSHFALVSALSAVAYAQTPAESPRPRIGSPAPQENGNTPAFKGLPVSSSTPDPKSEDEGPLKKSKGPTTIESQQATFDQKKNEAIFIGSVVVTDPEFNVECDKLTAVLKSAEKGKPAAEGATPKPAAATPKPATPKAATPAPASPAGATPAPKKGGGSGLQKAIAEADPGKRVKITQDKLQADGTMQHSEGVADKAVYDAVSGDITLSGMPQVLQGINRVDATSAKTIIILNRNGKMRTEGPSKVTIVDKDETP